ncbi:hypothetical protein, partial [Brucella anthropi]|uniref:hypothetical protein n=1 Tax=Brucella anthropi TaxID=529 RepID=UPI00320A465D
CASENFDAFMELSFSQIRDHKWKIPVLNGLIYWEHVKMRASNLKLLKLIFEEAGVIFIHANEAGDGVRWAKPQPSE